MVLALRLGLAFTCPKGTGLPSVGMACRFEGSSALLEKLAPGSLRRSAGRWPASEHANSEGQICCRRRKCLDPQTAAGCRDSASPCKAVTIYLGSRLEAPAQQ